MFKSEHLFLHKVQQCKNTHETMPHVDMSKSEHRFLHNSATVLVTTEYELSHWTDHAREEHLQSHHTA